MCSVRQDTFILKPQENKATSLILKMLMGRKIFMVLILLCWTLLFIAWQQRSFGSLLSIYKDDKDRTQYVYTRPTPWSHTLPTIYIITPTYSRPVQKADLTRLANTFLHVCNLHWILVEDSQNTTSLVTNFLRETGLNYTHLNVESPSHFKLPSGMPKYGYPKGIKQRNLGLQWLRETFNINSSQPGVVYFADDDNTYSLKLFEEMRWTQNVSVWPVAFAGGLRYESIKVNAAGKVYGWKVGFYPGRAFAIDMAGFAVNLRLILLKSEAHFKLCVTPESDFLQQITTLDDLEPQADNCTKVVGLGPTRGKKI